MSKPARSRVPHPTQDDGRGALPTEEVDADGTALDSVPLTEALAALSRADAEAVAAVEAARPALVKAIEVIAERLASGGQLVYVGAGTSGRLGVLDAAECPPTFGSAPEQIQARIAGGPAALVQSAEGAEDDREAGAAEIAALDLHSGDCVLGIAAGGTTPYVHGALGEARRRGAATLFLACVPKALVPDDYDVSIRAVTGPEPLAGSTRMKAGTATKLCLNAISTLVQARLGRVYGNLMVDVRTGANDKLWARGVRLVERLTGLRFAEAEEQLRLATGSVKVAAVMHARGVEASAARDLLEASGQHLRPILDRSAPAG